VWCREINRVVCCVRDNSEGAQAAAAVPSFGVARRRAARVHSDHEAVLVGVAGRTARLRRHIASLQRLQQGQVRDVATSPTARGGVA